MAEPVRRGLGSTLDAGAMLRALAGASRPGTVLDTSTLICLAGRWLDGTVLIGWNPSRVLPGAVPADLATALVTAGPSPVRFGGGWLGWLDYAGTGWFGFFDRVLVRDADGWWLESVIPDGQLDALAEALDHLALPPAAGVGLEITEATGRDIHLAAVERAITAIRAGQLYQVNVCARLSGRLDGSPAELFEAGLTGLAPDYAAFLRTPDRTVVSLSPELFLKVEPAAAEPAAWTVRSAPIKGTRPRAVAADRRDDPAALDLLHSVKDRAENVMIVDLVRNDLSRVCRAGSVRAEQLLSVQAAPGVWHLVSQVTGVLRPGLGPGDLLAAAFPPGSVTGAPKLRALQLIAELEAADRGLFTGAIGGLSAVTGRAEFSVAIRTFEIEDGRWQLGVGGGITADSVPLDEWHECLVKAAPLLALGGATVPAAADIDPDGVATGAGIFETMLAVDGCVPALADHLVRLSGSAESVYRIQLPAGLADRVRAAVAGTTGRHRVRLTVRPGDEPSIEISPATAGDCLSLRTVPGRRGCWRHKWADRSWLTAVERRLVPNRPVFTDPGGQLMETSRGNLAVVVGPGVLRTPVLTESLLPGVTRRRLLDAALDHGWRVEFGPLELADLRAARLTVQLSSISGVLGIDRIDGERLGLDLELLAELRGWLGFS